MGFINCRGVPSTMEEIKELLFSERIRFLGKAEIWLLPGQKVEVEALAGLGWKER